MKQRLLAVMGVHTFEGAEPCRIEAVQPLGAVKDLGWTGLLAVEAVTEGNLTIVCGGETTAAALVSPARLIIIPVQERDALKLKVMEGVQVRATLFDRDGNELEIGRFTHIEWSLTGPFEEVVDRSAGEFGYCGSCYGMFRFRPLGPGTGKIEARLGELRGEFDVAAEG